MSDIYCPVTFPEVHLREGLLSTCCAGVAMLLITGITISGNATVALAIRRATPRLPGHYPLASLAAADLMLGIFVLPLSAARELFIFHTSWAVCACWSTLDVLCCTASILSICALGWERWSGITAPLARARRAERARLFAALIWPISIIVALPTALVPSQKHFYDNELVKACSVNTNISYVFFSVTFSFYLPATGMLVLYTKILFALASPPQLRKHRGKKISSKKRQQQNLEIIKNNSSNNNVAQSNPLQDVGKISCETNRHLNLPESARAIQIPSPLKKGPGPPGSGMIPRQRQATKTIVMLMSFFLLCWTPFFVMLPIDSLCDCVSEFSWIVCTWLGYLNSSLNPLVYAAASPTIRKALRESLLYNITFSSSNKTKSNDVISAVQNSS